MNIKEIFDKAESGTLDFATFEKLAKDGGAKFADLSEGKYVSKAKYDDDLGAKDNSITELNDTIAKRDTDLADLQAKLKDAGTDATKLSELQANFDTLQNKYTADTEAYQQKLADQQYEFAVKEFANGKEFTSQAAKRDFVRSLLTEKLKMKGDVIIGADDFVKAYATDNADAFVPKQDTPDPATAQQSGNTPKPQFVSPTPGAAAQKQPSLSDMMRAANENPGANVY